MCELGISTGVNRLVEQDVIGIEDEFTTRREGWVADEVHENDEKKWSENGSLRNSRCFRGAVRGEAV